MSEILKQCCDDGSEGWAHSSSHKWLAVWCPYRSLNLFQSAKHNYKTEIVMIQTFTSLVLLVRPNLKNFTSSQILGKYFAFDYNCVLVL